MISYRERVINLVNDLLKERGINYLRLNDIKFEEPPAVRLSEFLWNKLKWVGNSKTVPAEGILFIKGNHKLEPGWEIHEKTHLENPVEEVTDKYPINEQEIRPFTEQIKFYLTKGLSKWHIIDLIKQDYGNDWKKEWESVFSDLIDSIREGSK
jgi:hypothetical protein